jgi:hypothetical protein
MNTASGISVSRLCSLFFADDGVLITRDHASTQRMINFVEAELNRIGLPMNARKTKVMIVPPFSASQKEYGDIKKQVLDSGGFVARGRSVEIVDEFSYLGVTLWWRWDFTRAMESARLRARRGLFRLRQAGFQNRNIPLVFQYRLACAHVVSHLDYVAPLVGVEGYRAAIDKNEQILSDMLRAIAGTHPRSSGDALKAESGTWPQDARIRMLQLRFFTKLCCSPTSSTHFRALALSQLCHNHRLNKTDEIHGAACRTPFFTRVLAGIQKFSTDSSVPVGEYGLADSGSLLHPAQALAALERLENGAWVRIRPHILLPVDQPNQLLRFRCTSTKAFSFDYTTTTKEFFWDLPHGTQIRVALTSWSPQLRLACFASLRRRGNVYRHELFQSTSSEWANRDSWLRDYAPFKRASYMEPYWFSIYAGEARGLLRELTVDVSDHTATTKNQK